MTKEAAPVSLTGGAGYGFEDQVAAWFLVHLLRGETPLEPEFGTPVSVDFQVRESGWLFDDLLITSRGDEGMERRLAASIKRGRQVTRGGFSPDFVEAVWEQWLGLNIPENPFQSEHDLLCLVTGQLANSVKSAWDEILQQASVTDPARLAKRLTSQGSTNKVQRALFASLRCPQHLAQGVGTEDADTAKILSHIRLLHFDFRSPSSDDEKNAIRRCQLCLRKGSLEEAVDLWGDLVAIAAKLRPRGGSVDLPQLLRRLGQCSFQEHPNYRADWNTLRDLSVDTMAAVRTQLGPGITISRKSLVLEISERLETSGQLVLIGESGSGKSALAKSIATSENYQLAIWLDGQHLEGRGSSGVRQSLGLEHKLIEILPLVGERKALLVLDALEKFSPHALQNAVELINVMEPHKSESRWHVLMTSQPLRWESVQLQLHKCGLQLSQESIHQIEPPDSSTLAWSVIRTLPSLRRLMLQPELGKLLRNLKVLDWVASTVSSSPRDSKEWVGLSDIIDAVWSLWIQSDRRRYARDGVLKKVGVEETQSFSGVVSVDQLTTPDKEVLADLEDLRLLNVQEGKVSFTHDLLGDWSRLQTLIAIPQQRLVDELRDRAVNPRWHTAIRLYGLRTLERAPDGNPWFQLLQQLDNGSDLGQPTANLVLEAVAIANNAYHLLERIWSHLSADEGALLKRLLRRFRHSATFPDPRMTTLGWDNDLSIWLASSIRIPLWPHWEPMLLFLHTHAHEVKKLALEPAGELCRLWLSQTPTKAQDGKPFPWRYQVAELALTLAREVQGLQAENVIINGKGYESAYEAFLYAAPDLPEQVSDLALELAKRRSPAPEIQRRAEESDRRRAEEREKRLQEDPEYRERLRVAPATPPPWYLGQPQDPWPAGPMEMVDEAFREVCLNKGAFGPLMKERPEVAQEVILALCIEPPQPELYRDDPIRGMRYGTAWSADSAMFFRGPFLVFLLVNPARAIELIVDIVDFATERWREWTNLEDGINADPEVGEERTVDIWIDGGRRSLIGDSRVFGWYRERLIDAPYVVSALMALEKWFYDKAEADEDISEWIDLLLKNARSVAFIGLLVALGKKHPELLLGCLRPIMSIWQVYEWDRVITQEDASGVVASMSLMLWTRQGEGTFNTVRDWHAMPHRKINFRDLVTQMLLSDPELQRHFVELREKWRNLVKPAGTASDSLEFLIERFNPANYKWQENEDGQLMAVLEWPAHLRKDSQAALRASFYSLNLMNFPMKCREVLEKGIPLDPGEVESLWQTLEYFVNECDEHGEPVGYLNNAVMAGIAVLTILHREWLEANEETAAWCERQIKRIVTSEQPRKAFDPPESVFDVRWQVFLGEIAIHLLAEDPTVAAIRLLVAQGVLAYHYETTRFVFKAAYQIREELGEEFNRLLNLGRLWAGIRWGLNRCQSRRVETTKLHDWYGSTLHSFVEQSLQLTPISLREVARRSENLIREAVANQEPEASEDRNRAPVRYAADGEIPSRPHPGLDWQVIQAAYAWLPPLAQASSERERKTWITIYKELLELVLTYIQTAKRDKRGEVKGTPYKCEYWVFEAVASLIPQLREDEQPQSFWQPILDLGGTAHYWVKSFLSRWFMTGSRAASEPAGFARHWRSMVEYALDSPLWHSDPSTPGSFRLTDLHIELMGLGLGGAVFDQEEYADAVKLLFPLYEMWAEEWLKRARVAEAFARFLVKPAARELMLPGLTWLAQAIPQIPKSGWDRSRLSDDLLSLLDTCWREHMTELESNSEVKGAFLALLNTLVAREHPGALALRDVTLR